MTRKVKVVTSKRLQCNISKTAGCCTATIPNYYTVCCEAVQSAILATAWVLVLIANTYKIAFRFFIVLFYFCIEK